MQDYTTTNANQQPANTVPHGTFTHPAPAPLVLLLATAGLICAELPTCVIVESDTLLP